MHIRETGARHHFAGTGGGMMGERFQGCRAVGRPLRMDLAPGRGTAVMAGDGAGRTGAATEAAEAAGPGPVMPAGGWARCARRRVPAMTAHASAHRSEQTAPRNATIGVTLPAAQRRPAPFSRASTTSLLALSTMPLPMGKPWA